MYTKIISALHALNIVFQALYSLAIPIGIGALLSYLLTKYTSVGNWIWVLLILAGVFIGLCSMIKFILTASANLERLEKQREEIRAAEEEKANRRAELRSLNKLKENEGENNG